MEPNNTNTNPNPQAQPEANPAVNQVPVEQTPQAPPKDAFQQDIREVKTLIGRIKQGIKEKRELAKQNAQSQAADGQAPTKKGLKGFISSNKKIAILMAVFLFFVVLLVVASLYQVFSNRRGPLVVGATPTPVASQSATPAAIARPSKYATDSAVLDIEKMITELDRDMSAVDIRESQLTPPNLDYEIKF